MTNHVLNALEKKSSPGDSGSRGQRTLQETTPARGGLLNWRRSIGGRLCRLGRNGRRHLCGARGRLGRRLSRPEKIGYTGEETPARLLAGASFLGESLLEAGDPALGRGERLLHNQRALNEEIGSRGLLRNLGANEFIGFGVFRLGARLIQPIKESGNENAFVRSHRKNEAHLRLFASFGWRRGNGLLS